MPAILAILAAFFINNPVHVNYTLHVDSSDLTAFAVTMQIRNAPDTFTIAAAAHPEYDDKYWRYIEGMTIENGFVTRADSVLWRVSASGGDVTIRYRVRPPAVEGMRSAWRAYLMGTGGLVGGPHAFLYVLGAQSSPATVTLRLPAGWRAATGLQRTADPLVFNAATIDVLMDSPIVIGKLREWSFEAGGVPHRIVYLGITGGTQFDTTAFRSGVERLTRESVSFWQSTPYSEYTFIFQDGAWSGGLEHSNSVTLGAPSVELGKDPYDILPEVAHEFIHTWNLMRIKPVEYRGVDYRVQPPVAGLWFSEGLTIFYGDLLRRRAGLPVEDSTRTEHLNGLITRYLANPGNAQFSAERVSSVEYNTEQGVLGNFVGSSHLLGELVGIMLDIRVRDATDGRRSMDDVMRLLLARAATGPGFTGADIQAAVESVCTCSVRDLFDAHVRGASAMNFDVALRPLGLRTHVEWKPATNSDGSIAADLRIHGWQPAPDQPLRLRFWIPTVAWVRAGLHTNDELVSVNGKPIATWPELRTALIGMRIGDAARVEIRRNSSLMTMNVPITGFDVPVVRIEPVPDASQKALRLRKAWLAGQ